MKQLKEQRITQRRGHDHMPALTLELKPRGRGASVRKAKDRYRDRSGRGEETAMREVIRQEEARHDEPHHEQDVDLRQAHLKALGREEPWTKPVDVAGDFARAAADGSGDGDGGGDGVPPLRISRAERRGERDRKRGRDDDFKRER